MGWELDWLGVVVGVHVYGVPWNVRWGNWRDEGYPSKRLIGL